MRRAAPRRSQVERFVPLASSQLALALLAGACSEQPTVTEPVVRETLLAQAALSLIVTPANDTILVGQILNLSARNANGSAINKQAVWTSADTSVATVIPTGLATAHVTGRRPGVVTIHVTSGPKSGSQTTHVRAVPVRSVDVAPATTTVDLGDSVQYSAIARDSAGNPLTGRAVMWHSTTPGVATINATGLAISTGRGAAGVVATIEGISDTATLIVVQTPYRMELANRSLVFSALGDTTRCGRSVSARILHAGRVALYERAAGRHFASFTAHLAAVAPGTNAKSRDITPIAAP